MTTHRPAHRDRTTGQHRRSHHPAAEDTGHRHSLHRDHLRALPHPRPPILKPRHPPRHARPAARVTHPP
ncbi:hypothetical protein, partial [Streptomyces sp. NRRL F-2664]|uniref:hypothetical protein n=1 Tax=Streptomyces sp. NRRL F-2664 TaxID=1463842 RepID=UPI001F2E5245